MDLINFLSENGVNYIRLRVWNNPYDSNGNGYGAGNSDLNKAIEIGKRATNAGLKVMIDFHYSDFWADPGRQVAPKAWTNMNADEKAQELFKYTKDSLIKLKRAGVNVGIVQVGNETTGSGIAGESGVERYQLFREGTRAIREVDPNIQIALHFTNPEQTETILNYAEELKKNEIDYDFFSTSYYSYWHGSMENLTKVLAEVNNTYGKNTLVAETSYAYTLDDGDGQDNVIRFDYQTVDGGYEASVQGQANNLRDVIDAANRARALGVFYWEPAWIPVSRATREINLPIWEKYGSGWASSYAISYDPNVTVNNYGGSEWDNQALFNFDGYALPTLKVFEFVEEGYGEAPTNLFINGGFEEEDFSLFYISAEYVTRTNDTPYAGENALHFWSNQNIDFIVEQKVNLLPGEYEFMVYMQGDENGESENIYTYIKYDNTLMRSESITLDGYEN